MLKQVSNILFYIGIVLVTAPSAWWLLVHYPIQSVGIFMCLVGWGISIWIECKEGTINLFGKMKVQDLSIGGKKVSKVWKKRPTC